MSITKLNEKFNKDNNSGIVSTTDDEDIDNKSIEFQLNHNKISEEVLIILDRDVIFKNPNYYVDLSKNLGEYNKKNETLESIFGVRDHSTTMTKYKLEDINATQENLDSILFNQIYNNIYKDINFKIYGYHYGINSGIKGANPIPEVDYKIIEDIGLSKYMYIKDGIHTKVELDDGILKLKPAHDGNLEYNEVLNLIKDSSEGSLYILDILKGFRLKAYEHNNDLREDNINIDKKLRAFEKEDYGIQKQVLETLELIEKDINEYSVLGLDGNISNISGDIELRIMRIVEYIMGPLDISSTGLEDIKIKKDSEIHQGLRMIYPGRSEEILEEINKIFVNRGEVIRLEEHLKDLNYDIENLKNLTSPLNKDIEIIENLISELIKYKNNGLINQENKNISRNLDMQRIEEVDGEYINEEVETSGDNLTNLIDFDEIILQIENLESEDILEEITDDVYNQMEISKNDIKDSYKRILDFKNEQKDRVKINDSRFNLPKDVKRELEGLNNILEMYKRDINTLNDVIDAIILIGDIDEQQKNLQDKIDEFTNVKISLFSGEKPKLNMDDIKDSIDVTDDGIFSQAQLESLYTKRNNELNRIFEKIIKNIIELQDIYAEGDKDKILSNLNSTEVVIAEFKYFLNKTEVDNNLAMNIDLNSRVILIENMQNEINNKIKIIKIKLNNFKKIVDEENSLEPIYKEFVKDIDEIENQRYLYSNGEMSILLDGSNDGETLKNHIKNLKTDISRNKNSISNGDKRIEDKILSSGERIRLLYTPRNEKIIKNQNYYHLPWIKLELITPNDLDSSKDDDVEYRINNISGTYKASKEMNLSSDDIAAQWMLEENPGHTGVLDEKGIIILKAPKGAKLLITDELLTKNLETAKYVKNSEKILDLKVAYIKIDNIVIKRSDLLVDNKIDKANEVYSLEDGKLEIYLDNLEKKEISFIYEDSLNEEFSIRYVNNNNEDIIPSVILRKIKGVDTIVVAPDEIQVTSGGREMNFKLKNRNNKYYKVKFEDQELIFKYDTNEKMQVDQIIKNTDNNIPGYKIDGSKYYENDIYQETERNIFSHLKDKDEKNILIKDLNILYKSYIVCDRDYYCDEHPKIVDNIKGTFFHNMQFAYIENEEIRIDLSSVIEQLKRNGAKDLYGYDIRINTDEGDYILKQTLSLDEDYDLTINLKDLLIDGVSIETLKSLDINIYLKKTYEHKDSNINRFDISHEYFSIDDDILEDKHSIDNLGNYSILGAKDKKYNLKLVAYTHLYKYWDLFKNILHEVMEDGKIEEIKIYKIDKDITYNPPKNNLKSIFQSGEDVEKLGMKEIYRIVNTSIKNTEKLRTVDDEDIKYIDFKNAKMQDFRDIFEEIIPGSQGHLIFRYKMSGSVKLPEIPKDEEKL